MRELICITCPRGCHLKVDEVNKTVTGNSCKRGEVYGLNEVIHPKRMITSTVMIEGASINRLPVRTSKPIDKELVFKCMEEINKVKVKSPIKINEVIIKNVLGTDVDIISTREL